MTFALFVGAKRSIIFHSMVGLQAGEHVWTAAIGFLITAVGLPVLTVVALAKVGGGVDSLSTPVVKWRDSCWRPFAIWPSGPLFATPRTATVSLVGIAPLTGDSPKMPLLIYSVVYFAIVILVPIRVSCWIRWGPCSAVENYCAGHPFRRGYRFGLPVNQQRHGRFMEMRPFLTDL